MKSPVYLFLMFMLLSSLITAEEVNSSVSLSEIESLFQTQDFELALQKLDQLLETDPQNEEALIYRVTWSVLMTEDIQPILTDLENISSLYENKASIYVDIGYLCIDNEKFQTALKLSDHAIILFPQTADLYVIRAIARQNQDLTQEAILDLEKAVALAPDYEYALMFLAKAYFDAERAEDAMKTVDTMLEINPGSDLAYHTRFNFYNEQEDREKALADILKAVEYSQNSLDDQSYYLGVLALHYEEMGRQDEAEMTALHSKALGSDIAMMFLDRTPDLEKVITLANLPTANGILYGYQVESANSYLFAIMITEFNPDRISFNWTMSTFDDMSGEVTMNSEAIRHATKLFNYFHAGEITELDDQTSVWISRNVYDSIKAGKTVEIDTGSGTRTFKYMAQEDFNFEANGVKIRVPAVRIESLEKPVQTEDGNLPEVIIFLDNSDNPLILAMELGWKIELINMEANLEGN